MGTRKSRVSAQLAAFSFSTDEIPTPLQDAADSTGNLALDRLLGSDIHLVPKNYKEKTHLIPRMEELREEIR